MLLLVTEIGVSLLKYTIEAKERSPMDRPSLHLPRVVYFSFSFSHQEIQGV
jgi:hypothetical protein